MADEKSIWKKEINLGRKSRPPQATPPAKDAAPESIWKKEIRLRKRPAVTGLAVPVMPAPPEAPAPEPEAAPVPPSVPEPAASVESRWQAPKHDFWSAPPEQLEAPTPEPASVVDPDPEPEPEAAVEIQLDEPKRELWSPPPAKSGASPPPWPGGTEAGDSPQMWPRETEVETPAPVAERQWDEPKRELWSPPPAKSGDISPPWPGETEIETTAFEPVSAPEAFVPADPPSLPFQAFGTAAPVEEIDDVDELDEIEHTDPASPPPAAYTAIGPVARPAFGDVPVSPAPVIPPVATPDEPAFEPEETDEPELTAAVAAIAVPVALPLPIETPEPEPTAEEPAAREEKKKRRRDRADKAPRKSAGHAKEIVGLRVGSSHLVAALVRNGSESRELLQLVRQPLDRDVVVAGEVREPDALASALKAFFATNKLPRRAVRLGIASNRIGVRVLEVPKIDDPKLLDNAIRFRAQELLSIPITEAVLDRVILGETETDEGPGLRVLLAFAHRELIDRYVEACKRAKIKLIGIDFDAFALLRAVAEPPGPDADVDRATVAIEIGRERTIFAVSEGGICDFTRVLDWGGRSLTVAVARALNLTPSEAEPVKKALSFESDAPVGDLTPVQLEAARSAMKGELQILSRELLSSLQFYQSRPGSLALGDILVAGGATRLPGMESELGRLLGVPLKSADPYLRVTLGKRAQRLEDAGSASIAVGLGIED